MMTPGDENTVAQGQVADKLAAIQPSSRREGNRRSAVSVLDRQRQALSLVAAAFQANRGIPKAQAERLFHRIAAASALPMGKVRAELIPDSSWKRAGKTLGPQASQTAARLEHVLSFASHVWGDEAAATRWLSRPHAELGGATPLSLLRTEAGGRAVEAVLGALEHGFPV
jgi:putative toxin-antitoxin system antitoxin component (TIGR02293 family)